MHFKKANIKLTLVNAGLFRNWTLHWYVWHHNQVFRLMLKSPKHFNQPKWELCRQSTNVIKYQVIYRVTTFTKRNNSLLSKNRIYIDRILYNFFQNSSAKFYETWHNDSGLFKWSRLFPRGDNNEKVKTKTKCQRWPKKLLLSGKTRQGYCVTLIRENILSPLKPYKIYILFEMLLWKPPEALSNISTWQNKIYFSTTV